MTVLVVARILQLTLLAFSYGASRVNNSFFTCNVPSRDHSMRSTAIIRPTAIDIKRARSLLYPIAAFLQEGGFSKLDALKALAEAFDGLHKRNRNRRMQHIGHPTRYADIIAAWTRKKDYVDPSGRPRALPLSGPKSFASLVERASPNTNVHTALTVLLRYRNIRRSKDGKYRLTKPFFYTNSNDATAFEPIAFFLSDASATLAGILKRQDRARRPEQFWRKVESISVSESIARKFATFARERSFLFLEELDDWLEAHRDVSTGASRKRRRVGLGLFSICSDYEGIASNSRVNG